MKPGTRLVLGALALLILGWQRPRLARPRAVSQRVNRGTYSSSKVLVESNLGLFNKH